MIFPNAYMTLFKFYIYIPISLQCNPSLKGCIFPEADAENKIRYVKLSINTHKRKGEKEVCRKKWIIAQTRQSLS